MQLIINEEILIGLEMVVPERHGVYMYMYM